MNVNLKGIDYLAVLVETPPVDNIEVRDIISKNLLIRNNNKKITYHFDIEGGDSAEVFLGSSCDLNLEQARAMSQALSALEVGGVSSEGVDNKLQKSNINEFFYNEYLPFTRANHKSTRGNESLFRNHLDPFFANRTLCSVSRTDAQDLAAKMLDEGYSRSMINRVLILLGHMFTVAHELGLPNVPDRKSLKIRLLKINNPRSPQLSPEARERLLTCLRDSKNKHLLFIICFILLTGARKREALDAKWCDMSVESGLWRIPVTKSGRPRVVYLNHSCIELLKALKNSKLISQNGYLFENPQTGSPYKCIYHSWDIVRKEAGLEGFRIHDLRHCFASNLVNEGVPIYDIQALLGHSNVKTTQRYAHLSGKRLQESVNRVNFSSNI